MKTSRILENLIQKSCIKNFTKLRLNPLKFTRSLFAVSHQETPRDLLPWCLARNRFLSGGTGKTLLIQCLFVKKRNLLQILHRYRPGS